MAATVNIQEQALGFLESQIAHIERDVYRIKYGSIQYHQLIPVSRAAHEWARTITYYSMDSVGRADFVSQRGQDMPLADTTRTQYNVNAEMLGIGYEYNLEELGQAMMVPNTNLTAERAMAARRAGEERLDEIGLRGDPLMGWNGLINSHDDDSSDGPITNRIDVAATWDAADADDILNDINAGLTRVWDRSRQAEYCDTLLLPIRAYARLATTRNSDSSDKTILDYLKAANVYTATSGRQLTIRAVRGLEDPDGTGSGDTGRAIVYRRSPEVLKFHLPMSHKFLDVWRSDPMNFIVPGIFRTAGTEIRLPGAMCYIDTIWPYYDVDAA